MTLTYILAAVILLGICIFIHELGHLLGGKMVGIKAKTFSIGYGKGVLKKQIGDTTYQVTLIPFGGYCQFYGDEPSEERKGEPYEFLSAHPLKRIVAVIMGPLFNLLLGIFIFFTMNLIGYETETNKIYIPEYMEKGVYQSQAYAVGLRTGDIITEINGEKVLSFSDILSRIIFSEGKPLKIKYERQGVSYDATVKAQRDPASSHFRIGIKPYGDHILLGPIVPGEIAEKAGVQGFDEVKKVNGLDVKTPNDFIQAIRTNHGKKLTLSIIRAGDDMELTLVPKFKEEIKIVDFKNPKYQDETYNITSFKLDLVKNAIKKGTLRIEGQRVKSFNEFKSLLKLYKGKRIRIENKGGRYYGIMEYNAYGYIGAGTNIAPSMKEIQYGLTGSVARAFIEPYDFVVMNIKGIGMLFSGELNVRENIRGPIKIAQIAGDVAYHRGISAFILLMAKISIILMVMNLLPIPVVDGSYIIFFLYEAIRGKPINDKVMEKIQAVGITMLIILGVFVIFNDLSSFQFFQELFK